MGDYLVQDIKNSSLILYIWDQINWILRWVIIWSRTSKISHWDWSLPLTISVPVTGRTVSPRRTLNTISTLRVLFTGGLFKFFPDKSISFSWVKAKTVAFIFVILLGFLCSKNINLQVYPLLPDQKSVLGEVMFKILIYQMKNNLIAHFTKAEATPSNIEEPPVVANSRQRPRSTAATSV